jgi:hypothetical protein
MKKLIYTLIATAFVLPMSASAADSAAVLDAKVDDAIENFKREVDGADVFLRQASGYLVFPRVIKVLARCRPVCRVLPHDLRVIRFPARRPGQVDRHRVHDR